MKEITDEEFSLLRDYIKKNFGINLSNEKKSLVYSRLRAILQEQGFNNFKDYYKDLIKKDKHSKDVILFIDKITTNHTFFMRETDHFDYFDREVLPYIYENYKNQKDLRLWCAGCSSGEESYTLKMIIEDFFKKIPETWNKDMLATDISTNVLSKAIKGIYPRESVSTLPDRWQVEYFKDYDPKNKIIVNQIKKEIIYRKFNLMNEKFPFKKKFQVIFCRNVMIYFDNETRAELVEKFYNSTEPGGYLFIGHSESLNYTKTNYKYVMPAVYKKI